MAGLDGQVVDLQHNSSSWSRGARGKAPQGEARAAGGAGPSRPVQSTTAGAEHNVDWPCWAAKVPGISRTSRTSLLAWWRGVPRTCSVPLEPAERINAVQAITATVHRRAAGPVAGGGDDRPGGGLGSCPTRCAAWSTRCRPGLPPDRAEADRAGADLSAIQRDSSELALFDALTPASLQVPSGRLRAASAWTSWTAWTWTAPAAPTGQDELARLTERRGALC